MLEELEYKQLAKFKVLSEPLQNPPHKCCGCGRYSSGNPNEPLSFIDMGFDLEFLGEVFICVEGCFREIMNQLGVLTRDQSLKYKEIVEDSTKKIEELSEANKELTNAMGSLNRAGVMRTPVSSVLPTARAENKPVISPKVNSKPSGTKQGPIKQINERRSTVVPSSPGDELLGDI